MKYLALKIPGYGNIQTPNNIPTGQNAPGNIIQFGVNILFILIIVSALIFIIYGGILWATSGGDKQKIDKARRTITFAIIGTVVAVLAFTIINLVGRILWIPFLVTFGII